MISNFWHKPYVSYVQSWPMIYRFGKTCSKIPNTYRPFKPALRHMPLASVPVL